ncbi:SRPBCC family protein [Streptomyces sp. NPDC051940]|uniref:SRPBCC family protein n=1 Tax=Streptomyces sp. NPDC051940 TaxID=3155675 RepID=UPI0034406D46
MAFTHYRFRSEWRIDAPPDAVYGVLERTEEYPRWWPQVREVRRLDGASGRLRFRSFLPYTLHVQGHERRHDAGARVLELGMSGDLVGYARFTVHANGRGSRALFEQEVEVTPRLMRWLALPGRPLFVANHAWMMRGGQRGLRRLLEERV